MLVRNFETFVLRDFCLSHGGEKDINELHWVKIFNCLLKVSAKM